MKPVIGIRRFLLEKVKSLVRRIFSSITPSLSFRVEISDRNSRRPSFRQLSVVLELASCGGNFAKFLRSGMVFSRSLIVESRFSPSVCPVSTLPTDSSKYPPAKPEALRLLAPQRGLIAIVKSQNHAPSTISSRLQVQTPRFPAFRRPASNRAYSRNCQTSTTDQITIKSVAMLPNPQLDYGFLDKIFLCVAPVSGRAPRYYRCEMRRPMFQRYTFNSVHRARVLQ